MVYYGAVSKGCHRCRQRKIKARSKYTPYFMQYPLECDQRKPGCQRCEKSDIECPGYRDLNQVLFRLENSRIIRRACKTEQPNSGLVPAKTTLSQDNPLPNSYLEEILKWFHSGITYPLLQPVDELGANFFFTKYTYNSPPYDTDYHDWLMQSYLDEGPSRALRAGIEAVGLAGISNTSSHAPYITRKSKEKYGEAMAVVKEALNDPVRAMEDSTLMTVLLLGVFEIINFETWDRFQYWTAHVNAATALLELRGRQQFAQQRGAQLYIQSRSQILLACMQEEIAIPPGLVRATYDFENSGIRQRWRDRKYASPASISEISFRTANLRAALRTGEITNPEVIRKLALEIDSDLESWGAVVPPSWHYKIIDDPNAAVGTCFVGTRHMYPEHWIIEIWNNWRVLRILVNHIVVQNEARLMQGSESKKLAALSVIRQLSTDICISVYSFTGSPRMISLVQPLYVACLEEHNSYNVRSFAVEQLSKIAASLGIRQAGLLASMVSKSLGSKDFSPDVAVGESVDLTIACPLSDSSLWERSR
ncbi:hypothetical protein BGW36DRAFT_460428 [Talaromyces proteolyticus]|uniref:Zn(2)-C6 fungal-type domain-containing protein n=1 Tax=Talaromyces proteolyticus TaxID=1131652 RepID=A0AAD4KWK8_9EURO|nr:uncharacterized protein BGW36DRAFT_460428 [Talaromyces proteolyticus]KAH8698527.1 hypothetical protein BGW36DRAFT_460428 [Talaromyces proteolyticus]